MRTDDQFVWRTPHEKELPELAGHDAYAKQTPPCRSLPLWGGIAFGGFGVVLHHPRREVTAGDWAAAVGRGDLVKALRQANPGRVRGPWNILCDNESFLRAPASLAELGKLDVHLWKLPARSPDLDPVERYWAWIRKRMRAMDLADLTAKRAVVGRMEYKRRFTRLVRSPQGRSVASNMFMGLRTTCKRVVANKGGASGK